MKTKRARRRARRKFKLVRRHNGYWVTGLPCGDMGPYDGKEARVLAEEDGYGVQRFFEQEDR